MRALTVFVVGLMLASCATMQYGSPQATSELRNAKGEVVGNASFWESVEGVRVIAQVQGVAPGKHGTHLHAVGKCDPPDFTTASGHFNPGGKKHGLKNPAGPHAGDLPSLEVAADGTGRLEYVTKLVTLASGPTSLFDADGSALVIHANPDDDVTDPTGNSGGRIACGVVSKPPATPARAPSGY